MIREDLDPFSAEELVQLEAARAEYAGEKPLPTISATPFAFPDPAMIPRRKWLLGRWLQRGELTAIIAPGGVGKTTFEIGLAVSLASGADVFDRRLHEGAVRVWCWNLEDDRDELTRQFAAAAIQHGLAPDRFGDRLLVEGLDRSLCTAIETPNGAQLVQPVYDALTREITRRGIDVLVIDPFVSSHAVNENDNGAIDAVAKAWKQVAQQCRCAIVLVHHTRKTGGNAVTAEDLRGASSLSGAVRTLLALNPMSTDEASRFGIADPVERRSLVRVDMGKSNRAPAEAAFWFKLVSVNLGNGAGLDPGDSVGAAIKWTPPDPFDGLSVRDLYNVQKAIAAGDFAENVQAKDWAGIAVADVLGLDAADPQDKARIKSLLRTWISKGALAIEKRHDPKKGREKPFIIVGDAIDRDALPTLKSEVGKGGKVGQIQTSNPSPPHPLYRGGGGGGVGGYLPEPSGEPCPRCAGTGCNWCGQ